MTKEIAEMLENAQLQYLKVQLDRTMKLYQQQPSAHNWNLLLYWMGQYQDVIHQQQGVENA